MPFLPASTASVFTASSFSSRSSTEDGQLSLSGERGVSHSLMMYRWPVTSLIVYSDGERPGNQIEDYYLIESRVGTI